MKRIILTLFFCLPFLASADLVRAYPLPNGNFLGEFNIRGNIIWQVILGTISKASAGKLSERQVIEQYIKSMADFYGTDREFMLQLAGCESGFWKEALNENEVRGGNSYGLFQWQVGSWQSYNKIFKTNLDRNDWRDQVKMTAQVIAKYGSRDWINCTRYIKRGDNFLK